MADIENIGVQLETFRNAQSEVEFQNSLELIMVLLIDSHQRELFRRQDGLTTIVSHLERLWQEQEQHSINSFESIEFGFKMKHSVVQNVLTCLIIAVGHFCLDLKGIEEVSLHQTLLPILVDLIQVDEEKFQVVALETMRNMFIDEANRRQCNSTTTDCLWQLGLSVAHEDAQEYALLVLCNLATENPRTIQLTTTQLSKLTRLYFRAPSIRVKIAIADLLTNVSRDAEYAALLMCEIDDLKPLAFQKHSGIVYLMESCESYVDIGLKQATMAMAQNLAWKVKESKAKIQRLGASSYLTQFLSHARRIN